MGLGEKLEEVFRPGEGSDTFPRQDPGLCLGR